MFERLKEIFKEKIPFLQRWYEKRRYGKNFRLPIEEIFTDIYRRNYWKDKESASGQGSNMIQTETLRNELPGLLKKYAVTSVLDVPCGDFNWMKQVVRDIPQYYGVDIVKELIEENYKKYATSGIRFIYADVTRDPLPAADLILIRDLFIHFSNEDVFKTLENLRKVNAKFLLTTTFTGRKSNYDIHTGSWRPINLRKPPFNFPEPIELINENCTENHNRYTDKSLGLWKIADLKNG